MLDKTFSLIRRRTTGWPAWLRARVDDRPTGLMLSVGLIIATLLTTGFINIAKDVLLKDEIIDIDRALIQAVYGWRQDWLTELFKFFTYMGGIEAMVVLICSIAIFAWRQRLIPVVFGAALLIAVSVTQSLKLLFGRLRPEEALRLVVENGFSFPSGHAFVATLMYGLAGYVLARTARTPLWRWVAGIGSLLLVGLIGFSRVYLGVHFPSDVLASTAFASAFLVVFVTVIEVNRRYSIRPRFQLRAAAASPVALAVALTMFTGLVLSFYT